MLTTMAWMYPGAPCDARQEYTVRHINVLKPQYYTLQSNGMLVQDTISSAGCNGYSPEEVALVKANSDQQFVTISGQTQGAMGLATSPALTANFTNTLITFLNTVHFTGIELDFEGVAQWTPQQYSQFKSFVTTLGNALHKSGYQLMIDGPAISNTVNQGYYPWKYEDFNNLPVDYLVPMAYDEQYDTGSGTAVQSLPWLKGVCAWMKNKVTDASKIVIGIPSYGYHAPVGTYRDFVNDAYIQTQAYPGFNTAQRNPLSGEMMWTNNGISYVYSDTTTLDGKLQAVLDAGLSKISVWHLGGNQWFSPAKLSLPVTPIQQPPTMPATTGATPSQIATAASVYMQGFPQWYSQNYDAQGNKITTS